MKEFRINIEKSTLNNKLYRKVIYTTKQQQLVLMNIPPKDFIHSETHINTTQFIRVESGNGMAYISKNKYRLYDGICVVIPANTKHKIINTGKTDLKLYTIYSPPEHPKNRIDKSNPDILN